MRAFACTSAARTVHLVLTGKGFVTVKLNGKQEADCANRRRQALHARHAEASASDGLLELGFTPGLAAYAFTFG